MKAIKIDVDARIPRLNLDELEPIQGALKALSPENEAKLRNSILERGFFVPMFVWLKGNKTFILDGHQRKIVLTKMKEEGFEVPKIPCVTIHAETEKEAREKVLLISSNFGKIQKQGLADFLEGIDSMLLLSQFELPDLDALKFVDDFFPTNEGMINPLEPLPAVNGDLRSVGGNGIKMLQLYFSEAQHQEVLKLISALQTKWKTENATDTVLKALKNAVDNR